MSLPAYQLQPSAHSDGDLCPSCVLADGLCGRDDCRRAVLPLIAENRGWLKLMGEARVEQAKRQKAEPKEKIQIARISRRNARKVARSSRRGYFGLARATMERKS